MADMSLIQQSLFDKTELYIPLKTAKEFGFPLQHHILANGELWGSVQDWLVGLVGSKPTAQQTWKKFQAEPDNVELCTSGTQLLSYTASDGKTYQTDHANERVLYALAQYVRDNKKRPQVAAIKAYLADAGAFLGWMIRNPEKAATGFQRIADRKQIPIKQTKAFRKHLDANYTPELAEQAIEIRDNTKDSLREISSEWSHRGAKGQDYGRLTNDVTEAATGRTVKQWRDQYGVKGTPREYFSAAKNAALDWVQRVAAGLHKDNDSHGVDELERDIHKVGSVLDPVQLRKLFPDMDLDTPSLPPDQKALPPAADARGGE